MTTATQTETETATLTAAQQFREGDTVERVAFRDPILDRVFPAVRGLTVLRVLRIGSSVPHVRIVAARIREDGVPIDATRTEARADLFRRV